MKFKATSARTWLCCLALLPLLCIFVSAGVTKKYVNPMAAKERLATRVLDPVGHRLRHDLDLDSHMVPQKDGVGFNPVIDLPILGKAKGRVLHTLFGKNFSAFHSLPYAYKPERFKYPVMYNSSWNLGSEVRDATYFWDRCPQYSMVAPVVSGSEDCLHVSVYSPEMDFSTPPAPRPVMVFIHGGAYITGEATLYMPSKLMEEDVVVVVVQYRLGTLGFLYSGTVDAPGNMGLMDQITALRWVNKYISYFGGDPDLVTVFGQSAGGASTSWLQITPLTRAEHNDGVDLAHRFAAMSGSALEYWTLDHSGNEGFLLQADALANCYTPGDPVDEAAIVRCMAGQSISDIVMASLKVYNDDRYKGGLGFIGQVPVVQSELMVDPAAQDIEIVIAEDPLESLKAGRFLQTPTMTGAVRDEGSLVLGLMYEDYLALHHYDTNSTYLRDYVFQQIAEAFGIQDDTGAVSNTFRMTFMPEDVELGDWDQMSGGLVDLLGMLFLKSGMWTLVHEIHTYNSSIPVFFYSFEYESDDSLFDWIFISDPEIPVVGGVSHADDLLYLFNLPANLDDRERQMVKKMITLYTNFAKYGNPTPHEVEGVPGQWSDFTQKWETYSSDVQNFMLLDDVMELKQDFTKRWNYNKNGYPAAPTTTAAPKSKIADRLGRAAGGSAAGESTAAGDAANGSYVGGVAATVIGACALLALLATLAMFLTKRGRGGAGERAARRAGEQSADNMAMEAIE